MLYCVRLQVGVERSSDSPDERPANGGDGDAVAIPHDEPIARRFHERGCGGEQWCRIGGMIRGHATQIDGESAHDVLDDVPTQPVSGRHNDPAADRQTPGANRVAPHRHGRGVLHIALWPQRTDRR